MIRMLFSLRNLLRSLFMPWLHDVAKHIGSILRMYLDTFTVIKLQSHQHPIGWVSVSVYMEKRYLIPSIKDIANILQLAYSLKHNSQY